MIEVRDLHYRYRGAGKSTTQKILIRLLQDYRGSVRVLGRELGDWDSRYHDTIGVSFELPNHYRKLTAEKNLNYFRAVRGDGALQGRPRGRRRQARRRLQQGDDGPAEYCPEPSASTLNALSGRTHQWPGPGETCGLPTETGRRIWRSGSSRWMVSERTKPSLTGLCGSRR